MDTADGTEPIGRRRRPLQDGAAADRVGRSPDRARLLLRVERRGRPDRMVRRGGAGPARPPGRHRAQPAPGRRRARRRGRPVDVRRPHLRRDARGVRRLPHVFRRRLPRELRRGPRAARDAGFALARSPNRDTAPRRRAGAGLPRRDRAWRPPSDPAGRRGAGRRRDHVRHGAPRHVGAHGRVVSGASDARRRGHERRHQCGRSLRPRGDASRRREHLCRHRPAGRGGAALQGPDGAPRRPLVRRLPRRHGRAGVRGLVVHR